MKDPLHDLLLEITQGEMLKVYKPGAADPMVDRAKVLRQGVSSRSGVFEARYEVVVPVAVSTGITTDEQLMQEGTTVHRVREIDGVTPARPFGEDSLLLYWATYYVTAQGDVWKDEELGMKPVGQVPPELVRKSGRPGIR